MTNSLYKLELTFRQRWGQFMNCPHRWRSQIAGELWGFR